MKPADILAQPALRLEESDRRRYFDQGYLVLPAFVQETTLTDLRKALGQLVEASRALNDSNQYYELADDHNTADPHPVVIKMVADLDPTVWDYVSGRELTDVAVDLLGPSVKFRESYVNYKRAGMGRAVSWHQDFPFFPTSNPAMITVLTYLEAVTEDMGPIQLLPGSHRGPLYDHYDESGWIGRVPDDVLQTLSLDEAVPICGPAGTVVIFDNFMVHGSRENTSTKTRPVMVTGYAAADAFAYTATPPSMRSPRTWQLVRGEVARYAHHEPIDVRVPPDWNSQDYIPPDWPEREIVGTPGYGSDRH